MDNRDIVPPTPQSFSRKEQARQGSVQRKEREKGKTPDCQQDQEDDMSMNQVFGHSQYRPDYRPQDRREERPQAPRTDRYGAHPLQVDRDRRPEAYEDHEYDRSPRFIRAGHHRGGRPDLGFYQEDAVSVPYPQEPLRRQHQQYIQPPEIGFDPYKDPKPPRPSSEKSKATSTTTEFDVSPGWYILIRFHHDGETRVRHALVMRHKHIEQDGGRVIGLARPRGILIHEGGDPWVTFGKMRNYGDHWAPQQNPKEERTNYCVLVLFFPSLHRAIQWFDSDNFFKQKDFPPPYASDIIALPVHGSADTRFLKTLVLTEYPKITHPEYFRDKFSIPTEDLMREKYKATPYVVKASSQPVDDPRQRVARHLRGCWIKRNSVITLSLFDSLPEAVDYFKDPEYLKAKDCQDRVSAPTTVLMDLDPGDLLFR